MLHLYNLQQTDSGQFLCKMGNAVTASYFLHVANDSEPIVNVYPDTAPKNKPHRRPPKIVDELNLEVFSNWEPWSACSQCNNVGKRVRFGMCTVKLIDEDAVNNEDSNSTTTSITIDATQENIDDQMKESIEILKLFKKGIPCRSPLLPEKLRNLPQISGRQSEIITGFCKVV
ncbi:unnamed protein product, partial [Timema podura]|nr:unnamed protein product [Timema podura]